MKPAELQVTPLKDQGEIIFSQLGLQHVGCATPLTIRKPHGQENYLARCACGLELTLGSEDQAAITKTAIDLKARKLCRSTATVCPKDGLQNLRG